MKNDLINLLRALPIIATVVLTFGEAVALDIDFKAGTWSHPNGNTTTGWDASQSIGTTSLPDGNTATAKVSFAGTATPRLAEHLHYIDKRYFEGFAFQQESGPALNTTGLNNYMRIDIQFSAAVMIDSFVVNDVDIYEVVQAEGWSEAPGALSTGIPADYSLGDKLEPYSLGGVDGVTSITDKDTKRDSAAMVNIGFSTAIKALSVYYSKRGAASTAWVTIGVEGNVGVSVPTPPPPPYVPVVPEMPHLYYTYGFSNDSAKPVRMNFFDGLPDGLVWDTNFEPIASPGLSVEVTYRNGGRDAEIEELQLPPGQSSLTLCTMQTQRGGTIQNEATLSPDEDDVEVVTTALEVTAEINLAPAGGILAAFGNSAVPSYGVVVTGTHYLLDGDSSGVNGDVAIGAGVHQNLISGGITGNYVVHPPGFGSTGNVDTDPGSGGSAGPISPVSDDLIPLRNSALQLSAAVASLKPTQSLGTITSTQTIDSIEPDGVNVIAIDRVALSGSKNCLILNGSQDDYFILNIADKMTFTDWSGMDFTGGIKAEHVIVNMMPESTELRFDGGAGYGGTFLAVQETNTVSLSQFSIVVGSIAGHAVRHSGGAQVVNVPFESPN